MSSGFREKVSILDNARRAAVRHNGNMPTKIRHKLRRPAHIYLAEWMKHRNLNAEQLAGRLETSKSVVSKLLNGHQRYHQEWLEAIAYALDCEVRDLYRPPDAPTADDLLARMSPETRESALKILSELANLKTG